MDNKNSTIVGEIRNVIGKNYVLINQWEKEKEEFENSQKDRRAEFDVKENENENKKNKSINYICISYYKNFISCINYYLFIVI